MISVAEHGDAWSGSTRLAAPALNSGSDGYLVCRFQYAAAAGVTANQRHVQPYAGVAESLDNQNFILTSGNSCPTVDGLATTLHQSCTSRNGNRASDCPSAAGSPA